MFRIQVDKTQQTIIEKEITTSGSANVYDIEFTFSPDWNGFQKTAVFIGVSIGPDNEENFTDPYSVPLDDTNRCKIPWELMVNVGDKIRTGVFGIKDLSSILPTNIVEISTISQGIYNGDTIPSDPTPTAYQEILNRITEVYEAITAGMVKGERGERGYKGEKGDRGERGYKGDRGPQGLPGSLTELKASYDPAPILSVNVAIPESNILPTSHINSNQEGSGSASSTNVRNFLGWSELVLNQNGTDFTQLLENTVYGGTFDWANGVLTITHRKFDLPVADMETGDTRNNYPGWINKGGFSACIPSTINGYLEDFECNIGGRISANSLRENIEGTRVWLPRQNFNQMTRDDWQSQYPDLIVQLVLPLIEPIVVNLSPYDIFAIDGDNILQSNCGLTSGIFMVDIQNYINATVAKAIEELTR